jgi:hypothetical protein
MTKPLIFCGVLIVHWIAQFLAWSYSERSASMRVLWKVLAAPLVHLAGPFATQYFWVVASLNSALWAAVITYIVTRYAMRH